MHYIDMQAVDTAGRLRDRFPILDKVIYANHASLSPWPRETAQAVQRYAEKTNRFGPLVYAEWVKTANRLRRLAAELLHAGSENEISLLQNTTEGINTLADCLRWQRGDNVVGLQADFPSNFMPWQALSRYGVEFRTVDVRSASRPEAALLNQVDDRTRVLTVSSVDWIDGFRLDLGELGRACRSAGVIFFVDAIQQFGALRLDVTADRVDVLSAGSHKWQMGPEGMAVFYCREAIREQLVRPRPGWHMLTDRLDFETPGRAADPSGRRFEPGTPNRLGQVALLASLDLLQHYGLESIEKHVLENTSRLREGLERISGIELAGVEDRTRWSGIVNFRATGVKTDRLQARLRAMDVFGIQRGAGIRLSPHFYQGAQMDELLSRIEQAVKTKTL